MTEIFGNQVIRTYDEQVRVTEHPIERPNDKLLHLINGKYYIEFIDGHIEPILMATEFQTSTLIDEIMKGGQS